MKDEDGDEERKKDCWLYAIATKNSLENKVSKVHILGINAPAAIHNFPRRFWQIKVMNHNEGVVYTVGHSFVTFIKSSIHFKSIIKSWNQSSWHGLRTLPVAAYS